MFMLKYVFGNDKNTIQDINNLIDILIVEYSNNYNLDEIIDKYDLYTKKYSYDIKIIDKMRSLLFEKICQVDNNKKIKVNNDIVKKNIYRPSIVVVWFYDDKYYLTKLNDCDFFIFCKYRQNILFYLIEIFDVDSKDFENSIIEKYINLFGTHTIINELN